MKQSLSILLEKLTSKQVQKLTVITDETLAYNLVKLQPTKKIFTAAELWNIQKNVKTRTQRRFL